MATKKNGSMDISKNSNQDENTHKPRKPKRMSAETPAQPTVIGIGASAGGLSALKRLFERVPTDSGVAFVVVVHLSPEHKSELAGLLQRSSALPVQQVQEDVPLQPNTVYVIPPGRKLSTIDSHLRLEPMEPQRSKRAPIDHFFRTLATSHDSNSVAIVLTGTGSDGSLGVQEIKGRGGLTIAQSPEEAEYDGMPRSAISTDAIDLVLPLDQIFERALKFLHTTPQLPESAPQLEQAADIRPLLKRIMSLIQARVGRDFGRYKQSTIMRRIRRRMQLAHIEELADYLQFLHEDQQEITALANDFLITVTSFFRDAPVYQQLEKEIIPELFRNRSSRDQVRVWSVGCATGEEAYSLAMLLLEEAGRHENPPTIQVFASDLHDQALKRAREGLYAGDINEDLTPERLHRFFQSDNGAYRIRKGVITKSGVQGG